MARGGPRANSGGPRPNSGGPRPGAGRKSADTKTYQAAMRALFEACVTPEDWTACIRRLVADAQGGNVAAFRELAPWIVGRVPEETRHSGGIGVRYDLSRLNEQELDLYERLIG